MLMPGPQNSIFCWQNYEGPTNNNNLLIQKGKDYNKWKQETRKPTKVGEKKTIKRNAEASEISA